MQKALPGGPTLTIFFNEGKEDPNSTESLPAKTPYKLRSLVCRDSQTLNAGFVALRLLGRPEVYC